MAATAQRTDPTLWDKVKQEVAAGDKGGKPGHWSARKAQMAVQARLSATSTATAGGGRPATSSTRGGAIRR